MIIAVRFDFVNKLDERISVADVLQTLELLQSAPEGQFCWLDFSETKVEVGIELLERLGCERQQVLSLIDDRPAPYFTDLDDRIAFTLLDASWSETGVTTSAVTVLLSTTCLITLHRTKSSVIDAMVQSYSRNFRHVALSPGFLLYELASHLAEAYTRIVGRIADDAEALQDNLLKQADESMFERVADLLRSVSEFSRIVVCSRETIDDLANRRSPMIPQSTQPYLEKKAGLLERLSSDISSERELLSETVSLYLGIVTHRTNRILSRLTVVGTVFLPLSFLAGVYGMNFDLIPELKWRYGYLYFWGFVVTFSLFVLGLMKRQRWL